MFDEPPTKAPARWRDKGFATLREGRIVKRASDRTVEFFYRGIKPNPWPECSGGWRTNTDEGILVGKQSIVATRLGWDDAEHDIGRIDQSREKASGLSDTLPKTVAGITKVYSELAVNGKCRNWESGVAGKVDLVGRDEIGLAIGELNSEFAAGKTHGARAGRYFQDLL